MFACFFFVYPICLKTLILLICCQLAKHRRLENMKKGSRVLFAFSPLVIIPASLAMTGCVFFNQSSSVTVEEKVEIIYAGSYEIKDYYDLGSETSYSNVLFLNCTVKNDTQSKLKYMNISSLNIYSSNELIAKGSWDCTGLLNIAAGESETYPFLFLESDSDSLEYGYYNSSFFASSPELDELIFEYNYVANPVPASSGLTFNIIVTLLIVNIII